MKKTLYLFALTICITFQSFTASAQNSEGWIIYKIELKNPFPMMISDENFKHLMTQEVGNLDNLYQKYFFTPDQYAHHLNFDKKIEYTVYDKTSQNVYSWEKDSKTAQVYDSKRSDDKILKLSKNNNIDTIMGIPCKSITLKTQDTYQTIWYNEDFLPIDPVAYQHHQFGAYNEILEITKSLPIKIDMKSLMTHMVMTLTEYQLEQLDPTLFNIPKFKKTLDGFEELKKLKESFE